MEHEAQSEDGIGESYRRQAWTEWTDPQIVDAWIRWHDKVAVHHAELTRLLLDRTGLFVGANVLDLGSGTGEPALTIASSIAPGGRVVATEISQPFVETIRSRAEGMGLTNLQVIQAEAGDLPFPDESFDVATSRLGVMYFTPVRKALLEVRRVLKPGGRVSLLAWGMPEQGTYYASCVFPFLMRSGIEPPPPDAPTPLRFSPPGSLYAEMKAAGFEDVSENRDLATLLWPGPPEELWQHLYEIAAPLRPVFDSLSKADFDEAYSESMAMLRGQWDGKHTKTTIEVVVGSASR